CSASDAHHGSLARGQGPKSEGGHRDPKPVRGPRNPRPGGPVARRGGRERRPEHVRDDRPPPAADFAPIWLAARQRPGHTGGAANRAEGGQTLAALHAHPPERQLNQEPSLECGGQIRREITAWMGCRTSPSVPPETDEASWARC